MEPPEAAVALMDELVEEILLRIPPDDPARLLHAALACKRWCRVVSDSGFRRRFREFHRTPPILGFLRNYRGSSSFVSTSSLRVPPADRVNSRAIDARHGRVLLQNQGRSGWGPWEDAFHVWDPITGERRELPLLPPGPVKPEPVDTIFWNAAVLCAAAGCEHLDCHRGPFMVVFVGSARGWETFGMCAYVYSSDTDAWSNQISAPNLDEDIELVPSALAGNVLYFRCISSVLKYELATRELSLIILPEECLFSGHTLLVTTKDGALGLAYICSGRLYLRKRKTGPDNGAGWASKVIKLTSLLPAHDGSLGWMALTGFAHGLDVFFVSTSVGTFTIDLKSMHITKVCEESCCDESFPYMSFCTPALGAASAEG